VPGTPSAPTGEQHAAVGPVPLGLEGFYAQPLAWGECASYADDPANKKLFARPDLECTRLRVPIDYAKPTGPTAQLGVLRRSADSPKDRVGDLVINPGGPGESGMSVAARIAKDGWTGELKDKLDLVGFDPRGIGASTPKVKCLSDKEKDDKRLEPPIDGPDAVARIEKNNQDRAAKCAANSGNDLLANVGTRDVVKDMDVLRSALGEKKLTYLGFSYGTRIGTAYAEAFPGSVRAMVLDGALDPNADRVTEIIGQVKGFKTAFDNFAKACAGKASCPLGKDPAKAEAELDKLLNPLKTQPIPAGDRKLSYSDASIAVMQALYSDQLWTSLQEGLRRLAAKDGTVLLKFADLYQGRDDIGHYSGLQDAFQAIRCVDDPPVKDRAVVEDEARRIAAAVPPDPLHGDDELKPALDTCAFWPAPNTMTPHEPKTPGLPKVLVISTTNDPATPYQAGVNLAKSLNASLLTVEGTRHTAYLGGIKCVDTLATAYLLKLEQPTEAAKCP
jgi:pimeloyl-ACP methyl ester carboxylesterase